MAHHFLDRLPRDVFIEFIDEDAEPSPGRSYKARATNTNIDRFVTFSVQFKNLDKAQEFAKAAEEAAASETIYLHCRVPGSSLTMPVLFRVDTSFFPLNRTDVAMSWGSNPPATQVWVVNVPAYLVLSVETLE